MSTESTYMYPRKRTIILWKWWIWFFERNEHEQYIEYLFSSPKKHSSNISQTIKQQPRVYPKTVSRLMASSPAHQNQYRVHRGIGPTTSSTATLTAVSSSVSPCLSPIRYAFNRSQISDSHSNEGIIQTDDGQTNQASLPTDDSSLKVSSKNKGNDFK